MKNLYLFLVLILTFSSCEKKETDPVPAPPVNQGSPFIKIIQDEFGDRPIVIAGSSGKNLIVSFFRTLEDGTELSFESTDEELPVLMIDNEGTSWDVFGRGVSGPRAGQSLTHTRSCMGYWFSFNSLYPGAEIYNGSTVEVPDAGVVEAASGWAIPTDYVINALPFAAVHSLDDPPFINYDSGVYPPEQFYVSDEDLVVGVQYGGISKAYPHPILDWHEVVNDQVGDLGVSVLYCPLTGTAQVWKQEVDGEPTRFGVSGFVLNSNLMPFDFATESVWTQLDGKSVFGSIGKRATTLPFVETSWSTWKEMFDDPAVVSEETGDDRDYRTYPYGNYKTNYDYIPYPVEFEDDRLLSKERVHGVIINNKAKVYQFNNF